jgi:hypothetical protein
MSNRFRHADAGRHPRQFSVKRIDVAHVVEPLELSDRAIAVGPGLRRDDEVVVRTATEQRALIGLYVALPELSLIPRVYFAVEDVPAERLIKAIVACRIYAEARFA